jgi:hypothetical protein
LRWTIKAIEPSRRNPVVTAAKVSDALRAIGEDLEIRGIRCLDLRCDGDTYIVQCGYQEPPSATPVTLQYSQEDIDHLDDQGQAKRKDSPPAKDFLALSHVFRGIGWYVENKNARLLRISNTESVGENAVFKIEYEPDRGDPVTEERPVSTLYDVCVNMYKQRGKTSARYGRWRR